VGLWAWLGYLLLAPALEEWAMRSVLLQELSAWLHRRLPRQGEYLTDGLANGLVSALFAAMHHGVAGSLAWLWFVPSWLLGALWLRFRSLGMCVLAHAWFNAALILVSLVWPGQAQAAIKASAPKAATLTQDCPLNPPASTLESELTVATGQWQGQRLEARVYQQGQARVLRVQWHPGGRQASGQLCWLNAVLLGDLDAPLPTLSFQRGLLHLRWDMPRHGLHARRETFEMMFDALRPGWPMVGYAHELASEREVSGVRANLVTHSARWHRRAAGESAATVRQGALVAVPPRPLAQVPRFTDFALVPVAQRVYRRGAGDR
jgi:Type II CAAX prenyl endopeptidase Rce1-like